MNGLFSMENEFIPESYKQAQESEKNVDLSTNI